MLITAGRAAVHIALAGTLFWGVNWLGAHSKTFGYVSLHPVPRATDPPTTLFNVLFRTGAPVAFVLLAATGLYAVGWDAAVQGIWAVPVYYFAGRLALNLFLGRGVVLNWGRELGQAAVSIGAVALLYDRIIRNRDTLMPDPEAVVAEIWITLALFVYVVLNGVEFGRAGAVRRSEHYIDSAYERYRRLYGHVVSRALSTQGTPPDPFTESVVYAVMIYEGFNRPPRVQALERVLQRVWPNTPRTVGPMQVRSAVPMADEASVRAGVERIRQVVERTRDGAVPPPAMFDLAFEVYRDYNPDDGYVEDVANVHDVLVRRHYPKLANAPGGVQ